MFQSWQFYAARLESSLYGRTNSACAALPDSRTHSKPHLRDSLASVS